MNHYILEHRKQGEPARRATDVHYPFGLLVTLALVSVGSLVLHLIVRAL